MEVEVLGFGLSYGCNSLGVPQGHSRQAKEFSLVAEVSNWLR